MLEEGDRLGALHQNAAHVGHIEAAAGVAVYRCSATILAGYSMGISHPPKSTIAAPAAVWTS